MPEEETYPGPATYSVSAGESSPPHSTLEVNGVQLSPLDPMRGWYDRMLAQGGEPVLIIRNIPGVILGELGQPYSPRKYREHCLKCGYGSQETLDILFPDEPEKE